MSEQREDFQPWTPIEVERELARLMNAVAASELSLRKVLVSETDAKQAYERAHVIAAHDPNCPVPDRSTGVTVGQRDSWIRDMCLDEFQGYEYAKVNLQIAKNYAAQLEQRCSLVQTMAKMVATAYNIVGSNR